LTCTSSLPPRHGYSNWRHISQIIIWAFTNYFWHVPCLTV
jgi:hypothetical protein